MEKKRTKNAAAKSGGTGTVSASQLIVSFGIALLLASVALSIDLNRAEAYFYDLRMRLKGSELPHPEILLLSMGEEENDNSQSIETHISVLENLVKQKPKAIVYFSRFDSGEVENKPAAADKFVSLAQRAKESGVEVLLGSDVDLSGEVLPPYPLSLLPHAPAVLHKDGTMFGEDKVMRRALLSAYEDATIHFRAVYPHLSAADLREKMQQTRGAYFYTPASSWHMLIRYPGNTGVKNEVFPKIKFSDVLSGQNLGLANGKIILVESLRKAAMNDYASTPFSRQVYTNPRLFVHASIIDTLLKNSGIIRVPFSYDAGLTFILALCLAFVAITSKPSRGVLALVALTILLLSSSLLLFRLGFWLPLVHPLFAMFFTYYLIVPYRAILEYKKRWEVQEKHDILVQVEELKGNFLSLMSHDLKTPVAQIQGLAELVLRQGNLQPEQIAGLKGIVESTENLDKFISKILNLTKVESNEIKLNKRSKDVNKILEQCVDKLEFQAKQKGVVVEKHLDPLFPIKADSALLIQVFTNIIDNAIKYSPRGTTVKIFSREIGDRVEVVVEDSGPGLDAKDQEQLFTKFFRGKITTGDETKGSGLGLYLSKYFIELHNGELSAESVLGQGSKFKVRLPIESE